MQGRAQSRGQSHGAPQPPQACLLPGKGLGKAARQQRCLMPDRSPELSSVVPEVFFDSALSQTQTGLSFGEASSPPAAHCFGGFPAQGRCLSWGWAELRGQPHIASAGEEKLLRWALSASGAAASQGRPGAWRPGIASARRQRSAGEPCSPSFATEPFLPEAWQRASHHPAPLPATPSSSSRAS